jgi:hypothetical protein
MMTAQTGGAVARRVPIRNFFGIPEVARLRGVSRVAVLYDIRAGKLRAQQDPVSRRWWILASDAVAYLETPVRGRS